MPISSTVLRALTADQCYLYAGNVTDSDEDRAGYSLTVKVDKNSYEDSVNDETGHCEPYLQGLKSSGLLIGVSAGSLAMQESLELVDHFSPELRPQAGGGDFTGMGITRVEILPHYHKYLPRFERFEERTAAYEQASGRCVIRLDDGHGVLADETEQIEIL